MTATDRGIDMIHPTGADDQSAIRQRLQEIWAAAAARDFETLESFHRYDEGFTSFKEGGRREDAAATAAGERAMFSSLERPVVDMRDLQVRVIDSVALVTFNGHFTGAIHGSPVELDQQATMVFARGAGDWKIVHEHFSVMGEPT